MIRSTIALLLLLTAGTVLADPCAWPEQGLTSRPTPDKGPTDVTLRLYVNDIISIQDARQSFTADVFFRADWQDSRLTHPGPDPCVAAPGQIWTPSLQLINRRVLDSIKAPEFLVAPSGAVTMVVRSYGEFSFRADLSDFPFDQQELTFNIVSSYGKGDVRLLTGPELMGMAEALSVANWTIQMAGSRSLTEYVQPVDKYLVRLDMVLRAKRLTGYYTWQQLLPLFLVVMMTWVVFWIPQEHVAPRVGLAATAMLTLIAYRFAMSAVLPPIAYLTRLDVFIIGASILIYASLATTVAVSYIFSRHNEELAHRVNRSARWLSPLLLAVVAAGAFYR